MTRNAAFPYALGPNGQTARATPSEYLEQLLEQILFVLPGERVNRPEFGCALRGLIFAGGAGEVTTALEAIAQGALRQWTRGDAIQIHGVDVAVQDSRVLVTVRYLDMRSQRVRQIRVSG